MRLGGVTIMLVRFRFEKWLCAVLWCLAAAMASSVRAQSSTNYQLTQGVINCGGDPQNGTVLASTSYQVTLDAIGDTVAGGPLSSSSYTTDVGLPPSLKPPGEVLDLRFIDKATLSWEPEHSVGTYSVYRGAVSVLPGGYGACQASGLTTEQATDTDLPASGQCFFYLVTARNFISEEGTKGSTSAGDPRPNPSPCP